ncbi:MAG: carboxypeptidase-like regulatory domain-containing protein [Planctomycetota bacterium]
MPGRGVAVWFAALLLAATMPALAQDRRPLVGVVRVPDGAPLADAEVKFAYVPRAFEGEVAADAPIAVTDASGRFRIDLLPCAIYRAWAVGPADAQGVRYISAIHLTTSEPTLELRATHRVPSRTLQVDGLAAWQDVSQLRVRFLPAGMHLPDLELALDADGRTSVPPLPMPDKHSLPGLVLQLLDPRGEVLAAQLQNPHDDAWQWTVPAPEEVRFRVVDARGEPLADTTIRQLTSWIDYTENGMASDPPARLDWRVLGLTGADGTLRANAARRVATKGQAPEHNLLFTAHKKARQLWLSGFRAQPDAGAPPAGDANEQLIVLEPATPFVGSLEATDQAVVRQQRIRVVANTDLLTLGWTITTDDDGRFVVEELPRDLDPSLILAPSPRLRHLLPETLRRASPPQPVALHPIHLPAEPARIDLRGMWTLQLQILDTSHGPAQGAQVALCSDGWMGQHAWQATPDAAGRLAVLADPGPWFVFAYEGSCAAWTWVREQPGAAIQLTLQPLPQVRGQVVDERGKAVAGARLEMRDGSYVSHRNALDPALDDIASGRNQAWIEACTTNERGEFACSFLDCPGYEFRAAFRHGTMSSEEFALRGDGEPMICMVR